MFGVIVEDERRRPAWTAAAGHFRGRLDNAEQQVDIAARKAGIRRDEPVKLYRFRVERYRESLKILQSCQKN